jgi:hypothetical protein
MSKILRFIRRDPAMWLTIAQAALAFWLTFHPFGLTDNLIPVYMAGVNAFVGLVTAILTKRSGFSFGIGLIQAAVALMAGYGLPLTADQTNSAIFIGTLAMGLFNWTQNSPSEKLSLRNEPMVVQGTVTNVVDEVATCVTVPDPVPVAMGPDDL